MKKYIIFLVLGLCLQVGQLFAAGSLVVDSLFIEGNNTVGSTPTFHLVFTLEHELPSAGKIRLDFKPEDGFDCSSATLATFQYMAQAGGLNAEYTNASTIVFVRDGTANAFAAGSKVTMSFGTVKLPSTPGSYTLQKLETKNSVAMGGSVIDSTTINIPQFNVVSEDAPIASFDFSVGTTQVAGTSFILSITNALNSNGNPAAGKKIEISSDNAHNAPKGQTPTFNDIIIDSDGNGSANQTLVKMESGVTLKGTATDGGFQELTPAITVNASSLLGEIKICEDETGETDEVGAVSITSGNTETMHAAGYDVYGNYYDDSSVDWSVAGGIGSVNPSPGVSTVFTAGAEGVGNVSAASGSLTDDTGLITVTTGDLTVDEIKIRNAPGGVGEEMNSDWDMTADEVITFYAASYNSGGKYLGDIEVDWTLYSGNLESSNPMQVTAIKLVFSPTKASVHGDVFGRFQAKKDFEDKQSGTVTIYPGAFQNLRIETAHSQDGIEVQDTTVTIEDTLNVYAIGYDSDNNYMGEIPVRWTTSDTTKGFMTPDTLHRSPRGTFHPKQVGVVTARADTGNIYDDTGIITVEAGSVHHLLITTESEGRGQQVGDWSLTTDQILRLWAAAVDSLDNFAGQASPMWGMLGDLHANFDTTVAHEFIDFNPKYAGTSGKIRIYHSTGLFPGDTTGTISITAGEPHHLRIAIRGSGNTPVLGDTSLTVGDTLVLHAAAFDADDNYTSERTATWSLMGLIGRIETVGASDSVYFIATRSGQGVLKVDDAALIEGYSGNITVQQGAIDYVLIRDEPNGEGDKVSSRSMTTDDTLKLYAAAYDAGDAFLGPALVTWQSTGSLDPPVDVTTPDSNFFFVPAKPGNGKICILHETTGAADTIQTIEVQPGEPYGTITLTPDKSQIPADDTTKVTITSSEIVDRKGNKVLQGEVFTVRTTAGTISTPDLNPSLPDTQVAVNATGKLEFQLKANSGGGTATITASGGSAQGITNVSISNINLVSITAGHDFVSQGQLGISVRMVVQNLGESEITITEADLQFTGSGGANLYGDYIVTPPGSFPALAGGETTTIDFLVAALAGATVDSVILDGNILTDVPGISAEHASSVDTWKVQTPASVQIIKMEALDTEVSQGERGLDISMRIKNNSGINGATATIDTVRPTFWNFGTIEVSHQYIATVFGEMPASLAAMEEATINFKVNVNSGAFEGDIVINGEMEGKDANSLVLISDDQADTTDSWRVQKAAKVQISSFTTSQSTVTQNQSNPWYAIITIQNNGTNPVQLDSCQLQFFKLNDDITTQYTLTEPDTFIGGGNTLAAESEDTVKVLISQTGPSTGNITLKSAVFLFDVGGGGSQLEDRREATIFVQEPSNVTIVGVSLSHPEATRHQSVDWEIRVAMENYGGSDIRVDTSRANTYTSFSTGTDFLVNAPFFKGSGTADLSNGSQDTLLFVVDSTGATLGSSKITLNIAVAEVNSAEVTTLEDTISTVIQSEPNIRIKSVSNVARNADWVNRKQNFNISVILENSGGITADEVDSVKVQLVSNRQEGLVWENTLSGVEAMVDNPLIFPVTAADTVDVNEQFTATIVSAVEDNTGENLPPDSPFSNKALAKIVEPAELEVIGLVLPDTVQAQQILPWKIKLAVRNNGQAAVLFNKPTKDDISFKITEIKQEDYELTPVTTLSGGDLLLESGEIDTVVYDVTRTGRQAGDVVVELNIKPTDQNNPALEFPVQETKDLFVETSAKIEITGIEPICNYAYHNVGQVNINQDFKVGVTIENRGAERADSVYVLLTASDTSFVSFADTLIVNYIGITQTDVAEFDIHAKQQTDEVEFTAQILSAKGHVTGLPVPIEKKTITPAYVKIHDPSTLVISLQTENDLTAFAVEQEFTLTAVVNRTGTSKLDNTGKLAVEVPAGYQVISEDTVNFNISDQTNQGEATWQIRTPSEATAGAPITVTMIRIPNDRNLALSAAIEDVSVEIQIETVTSSLLISSLQITEPEGARNGTVSTGQWFKIQASVSYSDNVTQLKASLKLPDTDEDSRYTITDSSQTGGNPASWVWKVTAPNAPVSAKDFEVEVIGTEKETDDVSDIKSFSISTVNRARLSMELSTSQGDVRQGIKLAGGQTFTLSVLVENTGVAGTVGEGTLRLDLGSSEVTTTEALVRSFQVDTQLNWVLTAPQVARPVEYISVYFQSAPDDENRSDKADIIENKKKFSVETLDHGIVTTGEVAVVEPSGAQDLILSTDQIFQIEAAFNWQRIQNIQATILYPTETFFCEFNSKQPGNVNQETAAGKVTFQLQALSNAAQNQPIRVLVSGSDANDEATIIRDTTDAIHLNLVQRAQADPYIRTEPPGGVVSVGQRFQVKAYLINQNQAALSGNYTAEISSSSPEYTLDSEIQQTVAFNDTAAWWVKAPYNSLTGKNITVTITSWPDDENSNKPADHPNTAKQISIITEEQRVIVTGRDDMTPPSLSKGATNVTMMGLIFKNSGRATSNKLLLKGIKFKLKDRTGKQVQDPGGAITRIAAVRANQPATVYGELLTFQSNSSIDLNFTHIDTIKPVVPDSVNIVIDVSPSASIVNFRLSIDTTTAFNLVDIYSNLPPRFETADGSELKQLSLNSALSVVLDADLEKSFLNYPNPFGRSGFERTKFIYYLEEAADVELKIFTILGELVWSINYLQSDSEGAAGMHEENNFGSGGAPVWWNGENNEGHKVLNGVYIAVFSTSTGNQAVTKVAVLK